MALIKFYIFVYFATIILGLFWHIFTAKKKRQKRKEDRALFFEKIKKNKPIVRISNEIYYYKGSYLTDECFILKQGKIQHHKNLSLIISLLHTM
ncbi:MAG: hypothetical protein SO424_02755 [[Pasteurella] aerogenes]|nr:hypothetical protein [[Pasteurella] aerogenes]